jgi:predicted DNA-binding transcriptional regulator YafY
MAKIDAFLRYSLIINKFRKSNCTFREIEYYLETQSDILGYELTISKRTFDRDLIQINALFGIEIKYDFSRRMYYLDKEPSSEINNHLLEAFDILNALKISEGYTDILHFEKSKPKGAENLNGLIHAIKNKLSVHFDYQKFWDETASQRTAEPYVLKEFKNRWYLIAKDLKDKKIKTFALDRLSLPDITSKHFRPDNLFDIQKYFACSFGVINGNGSRPEKILLSFSAAQGKYIKTLPLHSSQQIMLDNEDELQVKLTLSITDDFIMELLSFGKSVEVLQPQSLRQKIADEQRKAFMQYQ